MEDQRVYLSISINNLLVGRIQEVVEALANLGLMSNVSFYTDKPVLDEEDFEVNTDA